MKIVNVVGARPNFIKIAPLMHAMRKRKGVGPVLLHTGQHYNYNMSEGFFRELNITEPDVYLNVGSGSHAGQVARIMEKFDAYCDRENPDMVVVVGDVNSTIACSLVAVKRHICVAHVEAGVRSFDKRMPEEVNRIVTDSIADILFAPSESGVRNLLREGRSENDIHLVGNIMIDTLMMNKNKIMQSNVLDDLGLKNNEFAVLTLHRPSNVDQFETLKKLMLTIESVQQKIAVVFPLHPRTKKNLEKFGLMDSVSRMKNLKVIEPLGYFDFSKLLHDALFVMTDSGGVQEETTVYNTPCITIRENTEWNETIEQGTNELVGHNLDHIINLTDKVMSGNWKTAQIPFLWDGKTSDRIIDVLLKSKV